MKLCWIFHKANKADITIACMPVPIEEASRFGIMVTDETGRITEFEEKPEKPSSNLASMGIYIFSWPVLKEALIALKHQMNCDFGKHILPTAKKGDRDCLPMNTTATGKMWVRWAPTGKPTWS